MTTVENIPQATRAPNQMAITLIAMAATVMQVLDTTIANVALPHMQGSLGATQDQISWVLTSYIVATAIYLVLAISVRALLNWVGPRYLFGGRRG